MCDPRCYRSWIEGNVATCLLAACYDQSKVGTYHDRCMKLKKGLHFGNLSTWYDFFDHSYGGTIVVWIILFLLFRSDTIDTEAVWSAVILTSLAWSAYLWRLGRCWLRAFRPVRRMRVGRRDVFALMRVFMTFPINELAGQPLPTAFRSDSRYALLEKFQLLIRSLGFEGLVVLVDRVDEPDMVNGLPERMKLLIWPMLDNKLLKHPGLGFKLLLPSELLYYVDREDREFNKQRNFLISKT